METTEIAPALGRLFSELIDGTAREEAFALNRGDIGLLRTLDALSASAASKSVNGGATVAAHALHLRYGLSLMNQWASEGGNPFADARWDEAWHTSTVDDAQWAAIRTSLSDQAHRWLTMLRTPRTVGDIELTGLLSSIAHLAYHLGAIRQIDKSSRGPREGTFTRPASGS